MKINTTFGRYQALLLKKKKIDSMIVQYIWIVLVIFLYDFFYQIFSFSRKISQYI